MNGFKRANQLLSLCGLNCGLCPMHLDGHCGGCGAGNQSCALAKCSLKNGGVEYCFQCEKYPCDQYEHIDEYDSFITHQRQKIDLQKAQQVGIEKYNVEQAEKSKILTHMLDCYNDGRKKTLFCLAVNLLELEKLREIIRRADAMTVNRSVKEKAAFLSELLQQCANEYNITLKLKKK